VRVAFESAARTVAGRYLGATVSAGVAAHAAATNVDALLARADEALYVAKRAGRNRVEAELPHVDAPRIVPAPAAAAALLQAANTIEWSSYRRPRATTQKRAAA
jgi:predicted signal transduction protein with EAL and GGDEF domain